MPKTNLDGSPYQTKTMRKESRWAKRQERLYLNDPAFKKKVDSAHRGRQKIMALIHHGIKLSTKPIYMKAVASSIKRALFGGK